tara:strand:+ start:56 stop:274 length:219 start_codon:yes stop_codon:yes gene_type:complete
MQNKDFEPYVRCDRCHVDTPTMDMYWNEDHAPLCEDYVLPFDFEAVCGVCFNELIDKGEARWKTKVELAKNK